MSEDAKSVSPVSRARSAQARVNGANSRGPTSAAGVERSSQNALRHGLASRRVLAMSVKEAEVLEEFVADYTRALAPEGPLEVTLADRVVSLAWRLRRIGRLETELLRLRSEGGYHEHLRMAVAFTRSSGDEDSFGKLAKYEAGLDRAFYRALHELQRAQERRAGHAPPSPVAIDVTVDTL